MTALVWLRTDLRIEDNTALSAACLHDEKVLAVWLVTPAQWQIHDDAACKIDFWLRNLVVLSERLAALNIPLLIRHADNWQQAPETLNTLCRQHQVDSVFVNREYGINESRRDAAVQATLEKVGIHWQAHTDRVLFAPGSLLTAKGEYFQVFSRFRKLAWRHLSEGVPERLPIPAQRPAMPCPPDPLPTLPAELTPPAANLQARWLAGETAAHERLSRFIAERIEQYDAQRDFPALDGTSSLSPYLAAGVITSRQCLHAALEINQGEFAGGNSGIRTWINELLWRDFYQHILVGFPRVSMGQAFRRHTDHLPWRHAADELAAWQQGRTGIPLIDAAMRQLLACGWMHNRLRMVCAMFLSKNLLIDWRLGERWFMQHLIDGDLAANNGGWQWSASTGTDAVPYFRLFNPYRQSQRFDPEGDFIRHWLPELASLDQRRIHQPPLDDIFEPVSYCPPLVDLAASRQRALASFRALDAFRPPSQEADS